MGIFDSVVDKTRQAIETAEKKTSNLTESAKLQLNRNEANNELKRRYEALGKMLYDQKKNNKDNSELIDKCILTIDEINNKINSINIKLDGLKKTVKCIRCGTINSNEDNFCSKCGTKL